MGLLDGKFAASGVEPLPPKNPLAALAAQSLGAVSNFASAPFGYQNPPANILLGLLGIPSVVKTLENIGYGMPVTTGKGQTLKMRPETQEALLAATALAPATKGVPVGLSVKPVDRTLALEEARRNAVKMLGLPENNTAMDRARALGFRGDWFHGSPNSEIQAFDPTLAGQRGVDFGAATFATNNPANASGYSLNWGDYKKTLGENPAVTAANAERAGLLRKLVNAEDSQTRMAIKEQIDKTWKAEREYFNRFQDYEIPSDGSTVYPVMIRSDGFPWVDGQRQNFSRVNQQAIDNARAIGAQGVRINDVADNSGAFNGLSDVSAVFDPSRIRSRFAAFDPAKVNQNDLLAGFVPISAMYEQERKKRPR